MLLFSFPLTKSFVLKLSAQEKPVRKLFPEAVLLVSVEGGCLFSLLRAFPVLKVWLRKSLKILLMLLLLLLLLLLLGESCLDFFGLRLAVDFLNFFNFSTLSFKNGVDWKLVLVGVENLLIYFEKALNFEFLFAPVWE